LHYGTISVARMNEIDGGNALLPDITRDGKNPSSTIEPHPHLGYTLNKHIENINPNYYRRLNNVGLTGRDFPLEKDSSKFTILLTGGSVADQFGNLSGLEAILNERYEFPRPVVLLNGANMAWHQPTQMIALGMYGEIADAVVTLDGYNEQLFLRPWSQRIETPMLSFTTVNPIRNGNFDALGAAWQTNQLRQFAIRSRSRVVYLATRYLRNRIEQSAQNEVEPLNTFALPEQWSGDRRIEFNIDQYKKYIRLMHAMAGELKLREAYFIQPVPAIGKELTDGEKRLVGKLDYADAYRHMTDELLELNDSGIPVVSLLDTFDGVEDSIYYDYVHCEFHGKGYPLMAERIAAELSRLWNLTPKQTAAK
jgi:hypothetical protein